MDASLRSEILDSVFACGTPVELSAAWDSVGDGRQSVARIQGVDLLADLQSTFEENDLRDARVVESAGTSGPRLAAALDGADLTVQPVRADAATIDLMTSRGCIDSKFPPCFEANRDATIAAQIKEWDRTLFIAFTAEDLAVATALGLPAVTHARLPSMNGAELRTILGDPRKVYDVQKKRSCRPAAILSVARRVVLLACDLHGLSDDVPDGAFDTLDFLDGVERHLDFQNNFVEVWQPTTHCLEGIRTATETRDAALVLLALKKSLKQSMTSVRHILRHGTHRPQDLPRLRAELQEGLSAPEAKNNIWLKQTAVKYAQALSRTIVDPIVDRTSAPMTDSLDRVLLQMYANIAVELPEMDPLLRKAYALGLWRAKTKTDLELTDKIKFMDIAIRVRKALLK